MYNYLIADDEPMMRYGIKYMLESSGLPIRHIYEAGNGEEALKIFETCEVNFALLDINMPIMDGIHLAKAVSESYKDTGMCIISGYDDFQYAQKAIRYGVKAYLLKPVNELELKHVLMDLMEQRKAVKSAWMKHERFQHYVDTMFLEIRNDEKENLERSRQEFFQEISEFPLRNHGRIIADMVSELEKQVVRITGKLEGMEDVIPEEAGMETQRQYFSDSLDKMFSRMREIYKTPGSKLIAQAKKRMDGPGGWKLGLEELSAELGVNSSYFSRIFKEEEGITFVAYRTGLKMKRAADLMDNREKSIADIAEEVGYLDVSHFNRVFKKHTGMIPSDYRRRGSE